MLLVTLITALLVPTCGTVQTCKQPVHRELLTSQNSKIGVLYAHGLFDHSQSKTTQKLLHALVKNDIDVITQDMRGYGITGKNSKKLGHFEADQVVHDLFESALLIPQNKLVLFGHSAGTLIALALYSKYKEILLKHDKEIVGIILSAPAFIPGEYIAPTPFQRAILPLLTTFIPEMGLCDFDESKKLEVGKDGLRHNKLSFRAGDQVLTLGKKFICEAHTFPEDLPFYMFHSTNDKVTNYEGTVDFYSKLASIRKDIDIVNWGRHELYSETKRREFFLKKIVAFIHDNE